MPIFEQFTLSGKAAGELNLLIYLDDLPPITAVTKKLCASEPVKITTVEVPFAVIVAGGAGLAEAKFAAVPPANADKSAVVW